MNSLVMAGPALIMGRTGESVLAGKSEATMVGVVPLLVDGRASSLSLVDTGPALKSLPFPPRLLLLAFGIRSTGNVSKLP